MGPDTFSGVFNHSSLLQSQRRQYHARSNHPDKSPGESHLGRPDISLNAVISPKILLCSGQEPNLSKCNYCCHNMLLLTGHNICLLGLGQALPFTVDGPFYHSRHVEHALPIPCVVIRVNWYEQEASQQSDISSSDRKRCRTLCVRSSLFHYIRCDLTRFRWRVDANRPILYPWIWSGQLLGYLQQEKQSWLDTDIHSWINVHILEKGNLKKWLNFTFLVIKLRKSNIFLILVL